MSKRIVQHPKETGEGPKFWRSFGQLEGTSEFKSWQEREFQSGASELSTDVGRRGFLKIMTASAALAGLSMAGCRREEKALVPFTTGVEWSVPGKPIFYATSRPSRRGAQPIVATTHDGRPTKLDGNPLHELSKGGSNLAIQASLLDLYDPDRSRRFQHDGKEVTEADFTKWATELMAKAGTGEGLAFLCEQTSSKTFARLQEEFAKKFPGALWATYEPLGNDEAVAAETASFGASVVPAPRFAHADIILTLDCDFLGTESRPDTTRAFADRRKPEQKMNRLYVVENRYTTTGGMADHRLRVQAGKVAQVARQLAEIVAKETASSDLKSVVEKFPKLETFSGNQEKWIAEMAKDLIANKGRALVLTGSRQPAAVQVLGHAINAALGTSAVEGVTRIGNPAKSIADLTKALRDEKKIKTLFILGGNPVYNAPADLKFREAIAGVDVVRFGYYEDETTYSITKINEDGTVPADGRKFVKWHVPAAHFLEAWGDGTAADESHLSQQPMILPLFGGWSEIQLLNFLLTSKKSDGLDLVQETFKQVTGGITVTAWAKFLHDGFVKPKDSGRKVNLAFQGGSAAELAAKYEAPKAGIEIVFIPCNKVEDGRFSNNAWIQELPDPITKITWDNAAIISPKTARDVFHMQAEQGNGIFKFDNGSWITIQTSEGALEIPVYILPGHADDSISIALGYGRQTEGRVGGRTANFMSHGGFGQKHTQVGFNAYPLRSSKGHYITVATSVTKLDTDKAQTTLARDLFPKGYPLGITQEHGALEARGADLVREATFTTKGEDGKEHEFEKGFARDHEWLEQHHAQDAEAEAFDKLGYPEPRSFYTHPKEGRAALNDPNHQWAMSIDLSTCTGCSACMVACQAENNIPVVGKEQVIEGRELHWIRMDRYFVSVMNGKSDESKKIDIDEPRMVMQPMPCQHCESAPCETVCPVNATVHSDDGINVMAYNRCIGTRYCANNCPFKVRRFNFFDFNMRQKENYFVPNLWNEKGMAETLQLSKNPNVTVRMRGVMEKCTFCVQRVQEAKIAAKVHAKDSSNVLIPTDSFTVACAQVCSAGAIKFGNKADPKSAVNQDIENGRTYRLLDYLGIKPRVHYMARVMNPNHAMPDAPKDEIHELKIASAKEGAQEKGAK